MARHCEPPSYRDRLLDGRVPAIECVCRDEMRPGADVASAAVQAYAAPTCITALFAARERPLRHLIAVPSGGARTPVGSRRSRSRGAGVSARCSVQRSIRKFLMWCCAFGRRAVAAFPGLTHNAGLLRL